MAGEQENRASTPVYQDDTARHLSVFVQFTAILVNIGILVVLAMLLHEIKRWGSDDFHLHFGISHFPDNVIVQVEGRRPYQDPILVKGV